MIKCIAMRNIAFKVSIGCIAEEKTKPTQLTCDVELEMDLDFGTEESLDTLDRTIDYMQVLYAILEVSARRHYNLLESLGESCVREIFAISKEIKSVKMVVKKPVPILTASTPEITVVYP
jgi:dihydroneopterin aldolase